MTASRKIASAVIMSYEARGGGTTNQPMPLTLTAGNSVVGGMTLQDGWLHVHYRHNALEMLVPPERILQLWVQPDA
jgi:hypothetical protein